jgi:hypothetical protein
MESPVFELSLAPFALQDRIDVLLALFTTQKRHLELAIVSFTSFNRVQLRLTHIYDLVGDWNLSVLLPFDITGRR